MCKDIHCGIVYNSEKNKTTSATNNRRLTSKCCIHLVVIKNYVVKKYIGVRRCPAKLNKTNSIINNYR